MHVHAAYRAKCVSAEEAVRVVASGDWVDYTFCLGQPVALDAALAARKDELRGVSIRGGMRMLPLRVLEADSTGEHFSYASWHLTAFERKLSDAGLITHIPMVYRNMPLYYRKSLAVNVAMTAVSPMDEEGYFSFSLSNSATKAILETADTVIVEVNENLPPIKHGIEHRIHINDVTHVVEGPNNALPTIAPVAPTPVDEAIAALLLRRIPNGATVQLGIGALPNAIGSMLALSDIKDLGLHAEMLVDAYMALDKAGKITNRHKGTDKGKSMFTFCCGSQNLYDWARNNDTLATGPSNYTNDPAVLAQNPNMVTINSCVECDILGQVTSECAGNRQISGTGGQLDFLTGGYLAPGGQSFICCNSTYTDKAGVKHSRIRLALPEFAAITNPRTLAHCIVTEWGIADLAGRSIWERAERLIAIAHPDFRDELARGAEKLGFLRRSNAT